MTTQDASKPRIPKALSYPVSFAASLALLVATGMLVYSLVCVLFTCGLEDAMLWAVFGAFTLAGLALYVSGCPPAPLAELWPGFARLAEALLAVGKSLFVL